MATPLSAGSTPEIVTLDTAETWELAFSDVNACVVKNTYPSDQRVYLTYVNVDGTAPTDLTSMPVWEIHTPPLEFADSVTSRDVYLWSDTEGATVELQA